MIEADIEVGVNWLTK